MKEKRKEDVKLMAEAIDDKTSLTMFPQHKEKSYTASTVSPEIEKRLLKKKADEILEKMRVDIPKCSLIPVNGRIYVIEVSGNEAKTASGLIIPFKMQMKKNDTVKDINRYFVVAWDKSIPCDCESLLRVGREVNPFLPDAEEWDLPKVVDWNTGNVFKVIHYTELAGISSILPEEVEK